MRYSTSQTADRVVVLHSGELGPEPEGPGGRASSVEQRGEGGAIPRCNHSKNPDLSVAEAIMPL